MGNKAVLIPHSKSELLEPSGNRHTPQINERGEHRRVEGIDNNDRTRIGEHLGKHSVSGRSLPVDPAGGNVHVTHGVNIARDNGRPKNHSPVSVALGMHAVSNGEYRSVSPTEVMNAPDASSPNYMDPTISKRLTAPKAAWGARSRSGDCSAPEQPGAAHARGAGRGVDCTMAQRIIAEAKRN
jgi:hypothetical protein